MEKRLPLANGTILDERYTIVKLLGSGGFGSVYESVTKVGSSLAIKETYIISDKTQAIFEREAKLLAKLEHEDFPRVIEHFTRDFDGDKRHYLIMELIRGKDLKEMLSERNKPFEIERVLHWADQILDALEDLHARKIIHRDIKPANLKITPKGRIKVIDLGIAKGRIEDDLQHSHQSSSLAAATPEYSPLEQLLRVDRNGFQMLCINFEKKTFEFAEKGTDARSDVYALGATLYHLLTNSLPIASPTRALSIWSGKPDNLRPAHEINPKIPLQVSGVLQKMLAIEMEDRYESASALRIALKKAYEDFVKQTVIDEEFEKNRLIELEWKNRHQAELENQRRLAEEKEKKLMIQLEELREKAEAEKLKYQNQISDNNKKSSKSAELFEPVKIDKPAAKFDSELIVLKERLESAQERVSELSEKLPGQKVFSAEFVIDNNSKKVELVFYKGLRLVVGRTKDNGLCIADKSVSKIHAYLTLNSENQLTVADIGSTQGTFINDKHLQYGKTFIITGNDKVKFGTIEVKFQLLSIPDEEKFEEKVKPQISFENRLVEERAPKRPLRKKLLYWILFPIVIFFFWIKEVIDDLRFYSPPILIWTISLIVLIIPIYIYLWFNIGYPKKVIIPASNSNSLQANSDNVAKELIPKPNGMLSEEEVEFLSKRLLRRDMHISEVTERIFRGNPRDVEMMYRGQEEIYADKLLKLNEDCFVEKRLSCDKLKYILIYR